jgi:hypothetical protein
MMIMMKEMVIRTAITIVTEIEDHHQDTSRFAVRGEKDVISRGTTQFHK